MKKQNLKSNVLFITTTALSAALLTVCSWISVPAFGPFVPFTMQTFAVFLIAGLFDLRCSVSAVLAYILLGAAGVPVFSGFKSGLGAIMGATGGYIIGFVFTVLIIEAFKKMKPGSIVVLIAGMILGLAVCYAFGTGWFYFVFSGSGEVKSIGAILSMCVMPFLIPDAVKLTLAVILVDRLSLPLAKIGIETKACRMSKAKDNRRCNYAVSE